jgi:hypothetical protein
MGASYKRKYDINEKYKSEGDLIFGALKKEKQVK